MRIQLVGRPTLRAVGAVIVTACAFAIAAPASAQSCFLPPAKLPDRAVAQFMDNPASLLAQHPQDGATLMGAVRSLAGSDVRTVDALIQLASNASTEVKAAVAAGLANAAAICVWTRADVSQLIHEKVAASDDRPLITAFLSALRAVGTAALGGASGPGRTTGSTVTAPGVTGSSASQQGFTSEVIPIGRRSTITLNSTNTTKSTGDADVTSNSTNINTTSRFSSNRLLFRPEGPVSPTAR